MSAPYILARTFAEAHAYARETLGLKAGYYRVVNSPGTLKAVRGVDLYLVPGWQNRYDRFAMQSAMRWTRMNVIDVAGRAEESVRWLRDLTADPTIIAVEYDGATVPGVSFDQFADIVREQGFEADPATPGRFVNPGRTPAADPVETQTLVSSTEDFTNFLAAGLDGSGTPDWFRVTPESTEALAEEVKALDVAEAAEPAQEQPKRRRRRCKECGVLVEPDEVDEHAADHAADLVSLGRSPEAV